MNIEQCNTPSLPLTAGTSFADSLLDSLILLNYINTSETLEQTITDALASGDIATAQQVEEMLTDLDKEVFSLSFEA